MSNAPKFPDFFLSLYLVLRRPDSRKWIRRFARIRRFVRIAWGFLNWTPFFANRVRGTKTLRTAGLRRFARIARTLWKLGFFCESIRANRFAPITLIRVASPSKILWVWKISRQISVRKVFKKSPTSFCRSAGRKRVGSQRNSWASFSESSEKRRIWSGYTVRSASSSAFLQAPRK